MFLHRLNIPRSREIGNVTKSRPRYYSAEGAVLYVGGGTESISLPSSDLEALSSTRGGRETIVSLAAEEPVKDAVLLEEMYSRGVWEPCSV